MPDKLEITPELALSAAKVLKEYCEGRELCYEKDGDCCPFVSADGMLCKLSVHPLLPYKWNLT